MAIPMNVSHVNVKVGGSTVAAWLGAIAGVVIAVIDAIQGESVNAVWLTAISAGLVAVNNAMRSWQATAASKAGAEVAAAAEAAAAAGNGDEPQRLGPRKTGHR